MNGRFCCGFKIGTNLDYSSQTGRALPVDGIDRGTGRGRTPLDMD